MPRSAKSYIIGIDEVGRGSLAGPVVVCALALLRELRITNYGSRGKLKDSKQLTKKQREEWRRWIKNHPSICCAVARVYPRRIERVNISQAANIAATRAFFCLFKKLVPERAAGQHYMSLSAPKFKVLLDGGLYLRVNPRSYPRLSVSTRIKGDEKFISIKLASIVAKVTRDAFMRRLHKKYPQYGFGRHKGYGTAAHIAALKKFGASPAHRRSFIKNFV